MPHLKLARASVAALATAALLLAACDLALFHPAANADLPCGYAATPCGTGAAMVCCPNNGGFCSGYGRCEAADHVDILAGAARDAGPEGGR